MKKMLFKTNINCNGCIKSVTPYLNELDMIESWQVDIENPNKILKVESENDDQHEVIEAVTKAGFKIEPIEEGSGINMR